MKNTNKYDVTALTELLNPSNTISANRYLAHSIGMTETIIYSALISKHIFYSKNDMLLDGYFYSTISDLEESTTFGVKAQKSAINKLMQFGLIECVVKGLPAKRYFRICIDMEIIKKLIDKGKEIVEKFSKADNTIVKKPKSSEKIQFVHKDETCITPKAETCNVLTDNKTKDNKPKTKNYSYNSVSRSAPLMTDRQNQSRRKKIKFSDVLKHLGLEWSSIISAEPASEKAFMEYDEDIRHTQKCIIPYTLRNDKDSIKAALEYLSAKSYYTSNDNVPRADFFNVVITSIAEMVSSEKVILQGNVVMYYEIIDRLNEIISTDYLCDWLISFEEHWKTVLKNNKISNRRAYMKTCIWNWLLDYNFDSYSDELLLDTNVWR
ncbi:MAG: hypothetical protein J6K17_03960 [Oscillospiraceae bacterium]|nr:hypothetical protein [Oscillospiraceae bacterium]